MKNNKLITCITPNSTTKVIKKLEKRNIFTANVHTSRGASIGYDGVDRLISVLSVVVSANVSKKIFKFLYNELEFFEKNNGLIYQQTLGKASSYKLPNKQELEEMTNKSK